MMFWEFLFRVLRSALVLLGGLVVLLMLTGIGFWIVLLGAIGLIGKALVARATASRGGGS